MRVFKTKPGKIESIPLTRENFEKYTGRKPPYVQNKEHVRNGHKGYYAVCPICNNPIQIVGLYQKTNEVDAPRRAYGRHYRGDIEGLATYDENEYLNCPYANPNRENNNNQRLPQSITAREIWNILYNHYDRVIYILQKNTGIFISNAFAKQILHLYIRDNGWLIYESRNNNISYMLLATNQANSLVYRYIHRESNLYRALQENTNLLCFEETEYKNYEKLVPINKGSFLDLTFSLQNHQCNIENEELIETIDLVVILDQAEIYRETINVEHDYLQNLINYPFKRNQNLIDIAHELMGHEI